MRFPGRCVAFILSFDLSWTSRSSQPMKIVIAPDSFKESLDAITAAETITAGMRRVLPDAQYELVPMADGGEGTVEAIVTAHQGIFAEAKVLGPLSRRVTVRYGIIDGGRIAVLETASATGLHLVPPAERDPSATTSYGVGELISVALDHGCEKIIVGLGGSATNDGGAGMVQALGVRFLDAAGAVIETPLTGGMLSRVAAIDTSGADPRLRAVRFEAACDVNNPLCGERGATATFGPQKGASPGQIRILDNNLRKFYQLYDKLEEIDVSEIPGAGAAGGIGAAMLGFLHASARPGVDLVIEAVGLANRLRDAKVVITGEGRIDRQSLQGKAPLGVARLAASHDVPVIAIGGSLSAEAGEMFAGPVDAIEAAIARPLTLAEALADASTHLADAGERVARWLVLAQRLASQP